ncbi:hypothetical protein HGA91_00355 [candidate division WWE3 bacterium]|nr:hypothetical protein [candidate division WWE3 bacterium]
MEATEKKSKTKMDPLLVTLSSVGLIVFLVIAVSFPSGGKRLLQLLFPGSSSFAFSSQLGFPLNSSAQIGSEVHVPVTLNTNSGVVTGVDVQITYDRSKLRLVSVVPKAEGTNLRTFLPSDSYFAFNGTLVVNQAESSGTINVGVMAYDSVNNQALSGFSGTLDENNPLFDLVFQPLATGSTTLTMVYSSGNKNDSNVIGNTPPSDQLTAVQNSTIQIGPAVSITPTHSADINQDGIVNVFDVGIFASYYDVAITSESTEVMRRCDLTNNGVIDVYDLGILAGQYGS